MIYVLSGYFVLSAGMLFASISGFDGYDKWLKVVLIFICITNPLIWIVCCLVLIGLLVAITINLPELIQDRKKEKAVSKEQQIEEQKKKDKEVKEYIRHCRGQK
jgi:hypothetical protein